MNLIKTLNHAVDFLDSDEESQLILDVILLIEHLNNPNFRVAVFGPFNHGKSTLLNALLGSYTVPIALIPTTGAAISIKYGESLQSHITFLDGTTVSEAGTDILQRFAILDGDRKMRNDVASVAVFCPHPLLKNGIELVDLPGTNDRDEQDNIVRNQLLTADLVIQVLDARKLFTLQEIENLREWLISREIKTVIFVINFLNLLEVEEQKEVIKRARSIAQEFRLDVPGSISNLYRVDALPALKSRLSRDQKAAYNSGLITFESELYNLLAILSEQISQIRLPRLRAIAHEVKQSLETQSKQLKNQLKIIDRERNIEIERGRREAASLKKAFEKSWQNLIDWLDPEKLIDRYQSECFQALYQDELTDWLNNTLINALVERVEAVDKWISEACSTLGSNQPDEVEISLPDFPDIELPERPTEIDEPSGAGWAAVAGGLVGLIVGGPVLGTVGAASAYKAVQESAKTRKEELEANYQSRLRTACNKAVEKYLRSFSNAVLSKVPEYETSVKDVFTFQLPEESSEVRDMRKMLRKLESALNNLNQDLESDFNERR